jgi:histidine ammonia-lyase
MITISSVTDLNWVNLYRVAYQSQPLEIDGKLLQQVDAGHAHFNELIAGGLQSYGVTTGLGKLVGTRLDDAARAELPANMLRARAVAIGEPFAKPVARAMLLIRLVNFLSGRSAVRGELCRYLVDRLNDDFTPWVPSLGHGMAADAIANTHAFQTLIGEGFVYGPDDRRQPAAEALAARNIEPVTLTGREGLALINGICAAPALAMDAFHQLEQVLGLANLVAAVSIEGLAAPKDAIDPVVAQLNSEAGIKKTLEILRKHLNHGQIEVFKLQAPISYRVIVQVHGALYEALQRMREKIEYCLVDFSDNPLMDGDRTLSVGSFHNQHLANQVDHLALALAHVGCLSERRLHRMMAADNTGLNAQLAARPGLDAGLVVAHKASIDLAARLRLLAQPVSLLTSETSDGQEDYMSMAIPAISRLYEMAQLSRGVLAYELLAGITALRQRRQVPGDGVAALIDYFDALIPAMERDRSPAPDIEILLEHFDNPDFIELTR